MDRHLRHDSGHPATTGSAEIAVLALGTPPGIVLSPLDPALLGRATADLSITAGYVVASLDPVLRPATPQMGKQGTVEALAIAPAAEAGMRLLDVARALEGRGLDGHRYATSGGTFSPRTGHRPGYDLTLIGRTFTIGDVLCRGSRRCEPAHTSNA